MSGLSGEIDEGFVFAVERHQALAEAVGLPPHTVGYGFGYISEGEIPEGVRPADSTFISTGWPAHPADEFGKSVRLLNKRLNWLRMVLLLAQNQIPTR
jgi:hypothetical protein